MCVYAKEHSIEVFLYILAAGNARRRQQVQNNNVKLSVVECLKYQQQENEGEQKLFPYPPKFHRKSLGENRTQNIYGNVKTAPCSNAFHRIA